MERMTKERLEAERSPAELRTDIARRSKELLALENELGRGREDVETGGNSLDDQAQEETAKDEFEGRRIQKIAVLRREIAELEAQLQRTEKRAA